MLPQYMSLDLLHDTIRKVARIRLWARTLQAETVTWTQNTFPTIELFNPNDVQDGQHFLFNCTHPMESPLGLKLNSDGVPVTFFLRRAVLVSSHSFS